MPWNLDGNKGTNPAKDFLGTADNQPLAIRTNGAERVRVVPDGNVGIGTTTPGAKLDIRGSGGAAQCCAPVTPTLSLAEASSSANRQAWLQFHNGGEAEAYVRLAGAGPTGSGREGEQRLEIGANRGFTAGLTVTGNVGIGTTSPLSTLHVARAGHLNVVFDRSDSSDHLTAVVGSDGSGLRFSDSNLFFIGSQPYGNRNDNTLGNAHLCILPTGNVGIGTTSPDRKLHVVEASSALRFGHEGGPAVLRLENSAPASLASFILGNAAQNWQIRADGTDGNKFKIFDATRVADRLTIDADGNVGIGTTSPVAKLHLEGDGMRWGNGSVLTTDQGGSIELGGDHSTPGAGTPYIDFHFRGLTQDFNTRIINDADGGLSIVARALNITGNATAGAGSNGALKVRHIDGKHWQNDNHDGLFLNHGTGHPVFVGHANARAGLLVSGDTIVGAGSNATLKTRHVDGKNWQDDSDGGLHLNYGTGQTVYVGNPNPGGTPASLMVSGDVLMSGADCAEEFDVSSAEEIEPGTVMVIDDEGVLRESSKAYDSGVAGVVSGGGDYRAGLILDKRKTREDRKPVALMGKVACKVDARHSPIEVGDLLTTSPTPGHAMKADDPGKASGAIIGKALQRLTEGRSLLPILVSLQ